MSRYKFSTDKHDIVVGWDNPMQTLFGQVFDREDDDDPAEWIGINHDEIKYVDDLQKRLQPYAVLPALVVASLQKDLDEARPRTDLQNLARDIATGRA